ncbi:hypothetical protein K438DRAFT_1755412 [Mycena galopus ATCC 62051]|nr:hypothetical protein K438DRAFT_1755412 [Mycena galopus ATCC 62051]
MTPSPSLPPPLHHRRHLQRRQLPQGPPRPNHHLERPLLLQLLHRRPLQHRRTHADLRAHLVQPAARVQRVLLHRQYREPELLWAGLPARGEEWCVPAGSYSTADMDGPIWDDPKSIECSFDPVIGGLYTVSQDIQLCPSTKYTLRIATACDFWTGHGDFGIQFQVSVSGSVFLPRGSVCPVCQASPSPIGDDDCRSFAVYEEQSAVFTSPASGKGSLVISVRQAAGLNATQVPALFDQIFVNPIGDTNSTTKCLIFANTALSAEIQPSFFMY